jgi:hypothetical protein
VGPVGLLLSAMLVNFGGVSGDALGTATLGDNNQPFPAVVPSTLGRGSVGRVSRDAYLLPLALCAPKVALLLSVEHWFHARTYVQLAALIAAGWVVYGVGIIWLLVAREPMGQQVRSKFRRYVAQAVGR